MPVQENIQKRVLNVVTVYSQDGKQRTRDSRYPIALNASPENMQRAAIAISGLKSESLAEIQSDVQNSIITV